MCCACGRFAHHCLCPALAGDYKFATNRQFRAHQHNLYDPATQSPVGLCCGGHASLASLYRRHGEPTADVHYVTMLRDPVARIASALSHDVRIGRSMHLRVRGSLARALRERQLDLDGYLTANSSERDVNHAVAMLASARQVRPPTPPTPLAHVCLMRWWYPGGCHTNACCVFGSLPPCLRPHRERHTPRTLSLPYNFCSS